ncbi:MAG: tRNA (N6-isopentenyl adenosine(37)-C2)-methylthiotransferase MiaB [Chloroflexota bacterium]|nr:tRNA (N6-isopentenyl adenosine(37)-C2)-methylthiotransferase MiaB [Chloroflexota bacterium]
MPRYHIWTVGCQMNEADSAKLAAGLHRLGWDEAPRPEEADLVVLNTCVVRQKAEQRAVSKLGMLRRLKEQRNGSLRIAVMGCLVGLRPHDLQQRFPFVDAFARPQAFADVLAAVEPESGLGGEFWPQTFPQNPGPTAYVPVIHGCNKFCTFCIVPYRRGRERSRPIADVRHEVQVLVERGVKEVTLLGQTVEAYGHDLPERPNLADLFRAVHDIQGLERIRFLTSYPKDMTDDIIRAVAELPKVCECFNIPVQSGDDGVLARMRRGYTLSEYRQVVEKIRRWLPAAAITTDVIVGFCGETEAEFRRTYDLLADLRFDKVHVAAYSPRPGTIAWRTLADDVPQQVKMERLHAVEALQEGIAAQINARLQGSVQEVLFENVGAVREPPPPKRNVGQGLQTPTKTHDDTADHRGNASADPRPRLRGRTRTDKIVHLSGQEPALSGAKGRPGDIVAVRIEKTSAWSLQGQQVANAAPHPEGRVMGNTNDAAAL